jgi:hypothetical protein
MSHYNFLKVAFVATLFSSTLNAVNLSSKGVGEALIFPYYTVNNDLNTVYYIVNTTAKPKALKIRFYEGEGGLGVLDFNIYLSAFDAWTGSLTMGQSSIGNHAGEPVPLHHANDNSCAPFINDQIQEFLPYVIDADHDPNNRSMHRSTDGHFEVIEMGVVTDDDFNSATALTHDDTGIPNDCEQLKDAWISGYWFQDSEYDMANPTGGLAGSAAILDIQYGVSYSYDAIALDDFWLVEGEHAQPGSLSVNLANAHPEAMVNIGGNLQTSSWATGYEAVSAVLMQSNIFNEFDFDEGVLSKTEWVVTYPTKSYHVNNGFSVTPPFSNQWNGVSSCEEFIFNMRDRNNRYFSYSSNPIPPAGTNDQVCHQVNVIEFLSDADHFDITSRIFGSDNLTSFAPHNNNNVDENSGWAFLEFNSMSQSMTPTIGSGYVGLPVVGFKVQRITNNNAQPGLLAQYGRVGVHKGSLFNTPEVNFHE